MIESLLLPPVIVGGILTIVLFLGRNWILERLRGAIKNEYDEKLETYKAQLKARNDEQLEQIKARLQIDANEKSIRLTRVGSLQFRHAGADLFVGH
jgi:hypothetical protein